MRSHTGILVSTFLVVFSCGLVIYANPTPTPTPVKKVIVTPGVPAQSGGGGRSAAQPLKCS
jgi:hypothetical protein